MPPAAEQTTVKTPRQPMRHAPLACLLVLVVIFDLGLLMFFDIRGDVAAGLTLGLVFAQMVVWSVWSALAPTRVWTRTLAGFLGAGFVSLSLTASISRSANGPEAWVFFAIAMTMWLVTQMPLWGIRLFFARRLGWPGEQQATGSQREVQFGIGQLMVWTALVAVALGIGRWILPGDLQRLGDPKETVIVFLTLTAFNTLLAWPIVWSTLAPSHVVLWLIGALGCVALVTLAEFYTFRAAMGRGSGADSEVFWIMNFLQATTATAMLLAMRISGFRLIRVLSTHSDR